MSTPSGLVSTGMYLVAGGQVSAGTNPQVTVAAGTLGGIYPKKDDLIWVALTVNNVNAIPVGVEDSVAGPYSVLASTPAPGGTMSQRAAMFAAFAPRNYRSDDTFTGIFADVMNQKAITVQAIPVKNFRPESLIPSDWGSRAINTRPAQLDRALVIPGRSFLFFASSTPATDGPMLNHGLPDDFSRQSGGNQFTTMAAGISPDSGSWTPGGDLPPTTSVYCLAGSVLPAVLTQGGVMRTWNGSEWVP